MTPAANMHEAVSLIGGGDAPHFGIDEFLEVKYLCMGGVDG